MYKSIADGFKVINATEGLKGFTHVSYLTHFDSKAISVTNSSLSPQLGSKGVFCFKKSE